MQNKPDECNKSIIKPSLIGSPSDIVIKRVQEKVIDNHKRDKFNKSNLSKSIIVEESKS